MSTENLHLGKPVRIGIVGAGQVSQYCHIAPLSEAPGCEIAAISDLRPNLLAQVAERWQISRVHDDHLSLVADPDIDAVVVVTNRPATGPIVRDALLQGKPVLAEKPMAHTSDQARELVRLAEDGGVPLCVGYMKCHDPGVVKARLVLRDMMESTDLGPLKLVQAWSRAGDDQRPPDGFMMTEEPRPAGLETWPIAPDWMDETHAEPYAQFLNVHVHGLNLLRFLLGDLEFCGATQNPMPVLSIVLSADRVPIHLTCEEDEGPNWSEGVHFVFAEGRMTLRLPPPFLDGAIADMTLEALETVDGAPADEQASPPPDWAFRRQAVQFVTMLQTGSEFPATGRDAIEDTALAEEIWRDLSKA